LLLELDDDELDSEFVSSFNAQTSANSFNSFICDTTAEENETLAPLKRRPMVGIYGLKSPTVYSGTKSFESGSISNGHLNNGVMVNGDMNGTSKIYTNGDHQSVSSLTSPSNLSNHSNRPVSPSTSVVVIASPTRSNHNWKTASLRNTSTAVVNEKGPQMITCSSPAFRQQNTLDEGHLSANRSFSLKLEVPKNDINGILSGASTPQSVYNSSTNCLFTNDSVESTDLVSYSLY
jgi:hypothetical protein